MPLSKRFGSCVRTPLLLAGLCSCPLASAQGPSPNQIVATSVFNLANFVQWPVGTIPAAPAPITVCVLGRSGTDMELERLAGGQKIGFHKIVVRRILPLGELEGCHVLFLGITAAKLQRGAIESARRLPILLVAELLDFAEQGGTIGIRFQNNRIVLDVNLESAAEAGLKIDPRLLAVAHIVPPATPKQEAQ